MITPVDAAHLILADYDGTLTTETRLDMSGVQAAMVTLPGEPLICLIRGSDEKSDWARNFDFVPTMTPGDSLRVWWHRGFLEHSRFVYSWVRDKPVGLVIGHSLGAACTQIVATSINVPGMSFSSPMPMWAPFPWSPRPLNEELIQTHNRKDDTICYVPPSGAGFRHVGNPTWYDPVEAHPGEDHRIKHLIPLLEAAAERAVEQ